MLGAGDRQYLLFITAANLLAGCMVLILTLPLPNQVVEESYVGAHSIEKPTVQSVRSSEPTGLEIASLDINMRIDKASFDSKTGTWTDNGLKASYADVSVPANNSNGTTLIYAHAQWGAFAALPSITLGTKAKLFTASGDVYTYKATKVEQVRPEDTSVFRTSGPPKLVLQTCSGPWDSFRTLVYFDFVGVKV